MAEPIPALVVQLAQQSKGNPIAWNVKPDVVVIVFEDGRKLTFDRAAEKPEKKEKK